MPHRLYLPIVSIFAVLVLALSACSSSEKEKASSSSENKAVASSSASSGPFNSCDLLENAEIEHLFPGMTIEITQQGDKATDAIGMRVCFYKLSPGDMKFVQTSLFRTSDLTPELIKAGRTAGKIFSLNKDVVEDRISVKGLGQEAWYGGSGLKAGAGLHVLVNENTAFDVNVGLGKGNDDQSAHIEKEKAIARLIIARLAKM